MLYRLLLSDTLKNVVRVLLSIPLKKAEGLGYLRYASLSPTELSLATDLNEEG